MSNINKDHEDDAYNPQRRFAGDDPIDAEIQGFNTSATPDPYGFVGTDPDLLSSPGPDPDGNNGIAAAVAIADEKATDSGSDRPLKRWQLIMRRFFRSRSGIFGLVGFSLIVLFALIGPYISPWEYTEVDSSAFLQAPSQRHWFGTSQTGRDIFAMTIAGLRKSLVIGLAVATIQTTVAALIGSAAAYFGKVIDKTILWFIDLLLVIPSFLLIAIITQKMAGQKSSTWVFIFLLAAFGWMLTARVVRSMTLSVINLDYVRAARYMSVPSWSVITRHIIPNVSSYLIIDFTLGVVSAVMMETVLSYFGFGVQPPETSLGVLLSDGQRMAISFPWVFLAPATILVLTLVCINFMGDALRDAIDPSSKSGGAL